ncbi:hypothetical protein CJ030_MR0G002333 [Morella rubra]|uniref:Uncharacterized protein n=1 Tax=Morella rubra TaxID=262757 RepID=A0A6A1URC5_9ROSI|nr:hypothetical protein CJ030_MR0G002333 [Morella rubra]
MPDFGFSLFECWVGQYRWIWGFCDGNSGGRGEGSGDGGFDGDGGNNWSLLSWQAVAHFFCLDLSTSYEMVWWLVLIGPVDEFLSWRVPLSVVLVCWTTQLQEWTETNGGSSLLEALYKALDEVVKLAECEIYSYNPDSDVDPFLERGAIIFGFKYAVAKFTGVKGFYSEPYRAPTQIAERHPGFHYEQSP